jgi:hypothetical protein
MYQPLSKPATSGGGAVETHAGVVSLVRVEVGVRRSSDSNPFSQYDRHTTT